MYVNNVNGVWERMFVNNVNSDYKDYWIVPFHTYVGKSSDFA